MSVAVAAPARRLRGDDGSGAIVMIVGLFSFTFLALVWLSVDVDRTISNRSTAQSVAFQAARAGSHQLDISSLRTTGDVLLDPAAARQAAHDTARTLLRSYGVAGSVEQVSVDGASVSVEIKIFDTVGEVAATATVRATRSP